MDYRKSLKEIFEFEHPEELCQFEWGYWPETVSRWKREGMPEDMEPWQAVGITQYHRAPAKPRLYPPFEEQELYEDGEKRVIRDENGIIKEVFKDNTVFPHFIEHPVTTMRDFEALMERMNPKSPGRLPENWEAEAAKLSERNSILVMGRTEISFFGWPRDLMGLENLLTAYYDKPELIHAINRQHADFLESFYSELLADVEFDFIFMWEDMCYKNGPLISPALFREFMLPYYIEVISFFKGIRDNKVLVDSDGNVSQLIPLFIEAGVDGILPFEVAADMDIRKIRTDFPHLIIAGGLDKREIAKGRKAIDRELEEKLPFMFKQGGYLPGLDHHVPPEVSYEDFQYYLQRTGEIYKTHR